MKNQNKDDKQFLMEHIRNYLKVKGVLGLLHDLNDEHDFSFNDLILSRIGKEVTSVFSMCDGTLKVKLYNGYVMAYNPKHMDNIDTNLELLCSSHLSLMGVEVTTADMIKDFKAGDIIEFPHNGFAIKISKVHYEIDALDRNVSYIQYTGADGYEIPIENKMLLKCIWRKRG